MTGTTKVMFVGVETGDRIAVPDVPGAVESVRRLDPVRFSNVALSLLDHDASTRWWRDRIPATRLGALLAVRGEQFDDLSELNEVITGWNDYQWSACIVTESVPRWDRPTQPDPDRPQAGIVLTSLLHRAAHLSRAEFVDHWRDIHQPLSLRLHPQWSYVRNVVELPLAGSVDFDAVCEEGLAEVDDVLDPARFFGADGGDWTQNSRAIREDIPLFLDPTTTTSSLMREHHILG